MTKFTCDDKATLVSYLYGEVDAATRRAVDDHLAQCTACAAEISALSDVRSELGAWGAPNTELDFTIVKKSELSASNVVRPARWWKTVPAWAQAAAAILVLAAAASIANLQITSGPDGFSVSTGWMRPEQSEPAAAGPPLRAAGTPAPDADAIRAELASLEQKLRDEIRASRDQSTTRAAATGGIDDATIRRVQQLINEAEQRHSRELAARFVEFTNDLTLQRRADMQNITRAFNAQDAQLFRQRQLMNNMIRVSTTPQQ
jgi:hypothetical protein